MFANGVGFPGTVHVTLTFGTGVLRAFRTSTFEQQMNVPALDLNIMLSAEAFSIVAGGSSANVAPMVRVVVAATEQLNVNERSVAGGENVHAPAFTPPTLATRASDVAVATMLTVVQVG